MNLTDAKSILAEMETLGTEQARKTYQRHGVGDKVLGVSYADLGKLQKKLKTNHKIALDLWASGIHDAQILACMIADPQQADAALLEKWVKTLSNYVITDAFSGYVAKSPLAESKADVWIKSDQEWINSAGWNIVGTLAKTDTSSADAWFITCLTTIERDLQTSKNRTRHTMNNTLIAIGARNPALQAKAMAAAKRIGKVLVDHGLTNCKTRDAVALLLALKNP
ncbi:DNA alkylation repair protein [Pseudolysobacter antarcticus]|uniref:DNA alkylation repair protein n=1 Tax=Pseudolysobacter antarcticus TaxID=2511995 RepID=A0A411HGV3_9GAMM|nr:DNA alkylation repair protein [Pseudolysobacter antarcticus]QBB69713.1 DNA alkylation repair protein [Pseudolysobacter antarcticus]